MCVYCKSETLIQSVTTYVGDCDGCTVIIRNVPCEECEGCGEKYFSDEVARRLEKLVDAVKSLAQEVSIIDYRKAA